MSLVEDDRGGLAQKSAFCADLGVEERMVDHDDMRTLSAGAGLLQEAVVVEGTAPSAA